MDDVGSLDARAVARSVEVVSSVTPDLLGVPTPCSAWDLRALLEHMAGQHHGFAASALGETSDAAVFAPLPIGPDDDAVAVYDAAAAEVLAAFDRPDMLERPFWLPEIRAGGTFPGRLALSFHFLDYVVHTWDVAQALGIPADLPEDLVQVAVRVAELVPAGEARTRPGAAFGPVREVEEAKMEVAKVEVAGALDRLLALTGRTAGWAGRG